MMIDSEELARRLGLSRTRAIQLLNESRIPRATKIGGQRGVWVIEVEGDAVPQVLGGDRRRKVNASPFCQPPSSKKSTTS